MEPGPEIEEKSPGLLGQICRELVVVERVGHRRVRYRHRPPQWTRVNYGLRFAD